MFSLRLGNFNQIEVFLFCIIISKRYIICFLIEAIFILIFYREPAVHSMQFLDVINMKDPSQKAHFYRVTLRDNLHTIPKVKLVVSIVCYYYFGL